MGHLTHLYYLLPTQLFIDLFKNQIVGTSEISLKGN